ncbi:MAG: ABC transporter ATP-binding protein [Chloroflexota bacterium]
MSFIETIDLSQRFNSKSILEGINLRIEKGEVFAVIGPSGAGKTTLLRLIGLIDKSVSGKILFDGVDTDQPEKLRLELRRRLAFLQQKPVLFSGSVYENVAYGLKCRGVAKDVIQKKVAESLELVGLSGYENRGARTLSGGEAQRIAIARSVILKPEVLILDELTANLDPLSTAKIESLIEGIIARHDTTIVMSTHDMIQGQRLADRIGVLIDGELLQTGRASEVFTLPENKDVAEFVGVENILPGLVTASSEGMITLDAGFGHVIEAVADYPVGEKVYAFMRPEDIVLSLVRTSTSARNSCAGAISRVIPKGPTALIEINCGFRLVVLVTRRSVDGMGLAPGREVFASFKATAIHVVKRS